MNIIYLRFGSVFFNFLVIQLISRHFFIFYSFTDYMISFRRIGKILRIPTKALTYAHAYIHNPINPTKFNSTQNEIEICDDSLVQPCLLDFCTAKISNKIRQWQHWNSSEQWSRVNKLYKMFVGQRSLYPWRTRTEK